VRGDNPYVAGTRITDCDVLEYLAGGMSEREIFVDFPAPQGEHIRAALWFAVSWENASLHEQTEALAAFTAAPGIALRVLVADDIPFAPPRLFPASFGTR
jgi:uncharacterized protein (DUF433 family)